METDRPYKGKSKTFRWRMPEAGAFGFPANLTEVGIGQSGRCLRRWVFDEVVSVQADEHLEITDDGRHFLCGPDGKRKELTGRWERVDEPM